MDGSIKSNPDVGNILGLHIHCDDGSDERLDVTNVF